MPLSLDKRLKDLENHLSKENPILIESVAGFRRLDQVAYRLGLLDREESYATRITWWPLVAILGTFSAGKSTFINSFLGEQLQSTGNQAVDDRFTVICFSGGSSSQVLPGVALDADPRFPFYQMSEELDRVAPGEGRRIDSYLQLKTTPSERMRGTILIDSPGFDADSQRSATLRLTDHIIGLSDLVLVLFDARHPEPGAMRDTLQHLVSETIHRQDASKFLYILNQIDTASREDNAEDVIAAWQRSIASSGLTAGRFFAIYDEGAARFEDEATEQRFRAKRDRDIGEIYRRIEQVGVERAYRTVSTLEQIATDIEMQVIPQLQRAHHRWAQLVHRWDLALLLLILVAAGSASIGAGYWDGLQFQAPWLESLLTNPILSGAVAGAFALLLLSVHYLTRSVVAKQIAKRLPSETQQGDLSRAFLKGTGLFASTLLPRPHGWGGGSRRRLGAIVDLADELMQRLNDRFTNPSGEAIQSSEGATEQATKEEPGR